jgi:hypothetical protein
MVRVIKTKDGERLYCLESELARWRKLPALRLLPLCTRNGTPKYRDQRERCGRMMLHPAHIERILDKD